MHIFPNPTKSLLIFRNIPENSTIEIYRIDGKVVKRIIDCNNELRLDISCFKKGLYMVRTHNKEYYLSELLIKE
jgi:hypothetical protein